MLRAAASGHLISLGSGERQPASDGGQSVCGPDGQQQQAIQGRTQQIDRSSAAIMQSRAPRGRGDTKFKFNFKFNTRILPVVTTFLVPGTVQLYEVN
eukprot:SAG31_NODE_489_length_14938_cov_5.644113_4_plen_97_part_00